MFEPQFNITTKVAAALMRIEAARQAIDDLPLTPRVIARLRYTARLASTHYSTRIEGNALSEAEVDRVIRQVGGLPGHERDEQEVLGYFAALELVEQLATQATPVTPQIVRRIHATVMAGGRPRRRGTPFRDGQNVIRDGLTGRIVYLPPEASDVPQLMTDLTAWLKSAIAAGWPHPLRAAVAHYQMATVHPFYDGNGRTARLLTTLILHQTGYGLSGACSLDEYYAREPAAYYAALRIGPSHNDYLGRAEADITPWVDYFCEGMAISFEAVRRRAITEAGSHRQLVSSSMLRSLDIRQRRVVELFDLTDTITTRQVAELLGLKERTARNLCQQWCDSGFLEAAEASRKKRSYRLKF
mgnify:FL=1